MRLKRSATGRSWLVLGSLSDAMAERAAYREVPIGAGLSEAQAVADALSETALAMLRAAAKPGARAERHALRLQLVDLAPLCVEVGLLAVDVLSGLNRPETDALPARSFDGLRAGVDALRDHVDALVAGLTPAERAILAARGVLAPSGTAPQGAPSEASQALPPVAPPAPENEGPAPCLPLLSVPCLKHGKGIGEPCP